MWAALAILCAISQGTLDACAKKALDAGISQRWLLLTRYALPLPLLAPLLCLGAWPSSAEFWWLHAPWLPLEIAATVLTVRALRLSPLSLTLPFLAFTPMFLALIEGFFMERWVGLRGLAGIVLIVAGTYTLHLGPAWRKGPLYPLRAIVREPGSRLMLLVALLYSLTAICAAELTRRSSPWYFAFHYAAVMATLFAVFSLRRGANRAAWRWHWALPAGGLALAAMAATNMWAFALGSHVSYVIALKRLSGAVSVVYGRLWFDEQAWGARLVGSLIMAVGSALILTGG